MKLGIRMGDSRRWAFDEWSLQHMGSFLLHLHCNTSCTRTRSEVRYSERQTRVGKLEASKRGRKGQIQDEGDGSGRDMKRQEPQ